MGLVLKGGGELGKGVTISEVKRSSFTGTWKPVYGERDEYPDNYNQAVIMLTDRKTGTPSLAIRSEEHTSELQSLMRNSYAVFCLKKKNILPIITTKKRLK